MTQREIIRVFPRRTQATPDDELAFVGHPPLPGFRPNADEVHVSCTFTWDLRQAKRLVRSWGRFYPKVRLGGPAAGGQAGEFVPGMYLKPGYVITSRGCPKSCGFCLVPEREGKLRVLPVRDGWDVLDNNLLACPAEHINAVFEMLARQPQPARFTGGLDATRITPEMAGWLVDVGFSIAYTAYDAPYRGAAVERAIKALREAGGWTLRTSQRKLGCYVLCGYFDESLNRIQSRLEWIVKLGATPFPMFYRAPSGRKDRRIDAMKRKLRKWMRPGRIYANSTPPERTLFA